MNLVLTCDKSWVSHPTHLVLTNMSRTFAVRIDPTSLPTGVHTTSVKAYDASCVEKGPVFRVPITIVQPYVFPEDQETKEVCFSNVVFKPSQMQRHYLLVPENATWAVIRLTANEKSNLRLHTLQLRPRKTSKTNQYFKSVQLSPNIVQSHCTGVKGGITMEVVVAKFWSDMTESTVTYSVEFHGIKPDCSDIVMQATEGIYSVDLYSGPISEEVTPCVTLKNVVNTCRPSDAKIFVLSPDRDTIPNGRQIYELQLTYTFHVKHETEVTPYCPYLTHLLYESEFESQLWMLFSSSKKYICSGDAYADTTSTKLDKGDYTLRMHVRHERKDLLEKLTDKPMLISQKLSSPLQLDVYGSEKAAVTGGRTISSEVLYKNSIKPVYIAPMGSDKKDKVAKAAAMGQYLTGVISYAKEELPKKAASYHIRYILPDASKASSSSSKSSSQSESSSKESSSSSTPSVAPNGASEATSSSPNKDTKERSSKMKLDDYNEALVDFKISTLEKLEKGEHADALYEELRAAHPDKLSIPVAMLKHLRSAWDKCFYPIMPDPKAPISADPALLKRNISVANTVIDQIDQNALLAYYGMKADLNPDSGKVKTQMDRQKSALIDALVAKGLVLCFLYLRKSDSETVTLDDIDAVRREIFKFVDQKDSIIQNFLMWHAAINGHLGRLLKIMMNTLNEKSSKELERAFVAALRANGWEFWANHVEESRYVRYPQSYRLF